MDKHLENDMDLFEIFGYGQESLTGREKGSSTRQAHPAEPMGTQLRVFLSTRFTKLSRRGRRDKRAIRVDDRGPRDVYGRFCDIFVQVPDNDDGLFLLKMQHPPHNDKVDELVKTQGGRIIETSMGRSITRITFLIPVRPKNGPFLRRLAREIAKTTGRNQHYHDRCWKWISPRTAASLNILASRLDEFRPASKPCV